MEKAELIKALRNVGDEYGEIDFNAVNKRLEQVYKFRATTAKAVAAMIGYAPSKISELKNDYCDERHKQPADGKLEQFFRKLDLIALALDVSPIWLKYNIGEMGNNAISFDETKKDTAAAGEDSAARVPISSNLGIEDIARSISSVALSLPDSLCNLCIRSCPLSVANIEGWKADISEFHDDFALELSLSIPLFSINFDERAAVFTPFGNYMKAYFEDFIELKKISPLILENEEKERRAARGLQGVFRNTPAVIKKDSSLSAHFAFEREYVDNEPIFVLSDGSLYQGMPF